MVMQLVELMIMIFTLLLLSLDDVGIAVIQCLHMSSRTMISASITLLVCWYRRVRRKYEPYY
jgi:hypothetical protein